MRFRSNEEIWEECDKHDDAWIEARLKVGEFNDNPAAAHEWLIKRQHASNDRRMQREMRHTRWALGASWVLVVISLMAAVWQKNDAEEQREIMKAQLEQQQKDSAAQLKNAKELLDVQISVEMDKQFDSPEMRLARKRLATELLHHRKVTETRLFDFFDKVAMYTHNHLVDRDIVHQSYSYWLERYWPAMKASYVENFRKEEKDSGYYEDTEELYKEMLTEDKQEGLPSPSQKEIQRFLKEEAELPK